MVVVEVVVVLLIGELAVMIAADCSVGECGGACAVEEEMTATMTRRGERWGRGGSWTQCAQLY